jgi:hypothetical protein
MTTSSLENMLDTEIKHAATAPLRMLRRLSTRRSLPNFSHEIIRVDHYISELFLVPSGRHLVLLTWEGLEVLDLATNYHFENPWGTLVKNRVFVPGGRASLCGVAQHPSPAKDAFRIATQDSKGEQYVLYRHLTRFA